MNPGLVIIIAIIAIAVWVLGANAYQKIGGVVKKRVDKVVEEIKEEENE